MKIGIKFKIPNKWGNVIENILHNVDLKKYIWKITEDEVYIKKGMEFLFPHKKNMLSGKEFMDIISNNVYYTVFVNIQAYLNTNNFYNIETYADFEKSKCDIIILVIDNIFVEVYAKSESILEIIEKNAIKNEYDEIKFITGEIDKNKRLRAM